MKELAVKIIETVIVTVLYKKPEKRLIIYVMMEKI